MSGEAAGEDVVRNGAEAAAATRPPLIILDQLQDYLDSRGIGSGELRVRPIGGGHSNVTYLLERGETQVVLRRPPRPPLAPSTHDVVREAGIVGPLTERVRVPKILAVCEDPSVVGMPFYLMEYIPAHVVGAELPDEVDDVNDRASFGAELVDALVELHSVDPAAVGLDQLSASSGYLARQLRRFTALWQQTRTRELPEIDRAASWLAARQPDSRTNTIVHGDYRLGNVMFQRQGALRLVAILDWEMATLGDPLADLGYMVATWAEPGDEETPMHVLSKATRLPGFGSRDDLKQRYADRMGAVGLDDLVWYEVLALWKAAIFLEGSYARFKAGMTDDPYFATLESGIPALAGVMAERIRGAG